MANLTLAPEDDDFESSPAQKAGSNSPTGLERFRLNFNAEKVEFGSVSPWSGIEQKPDISGSGITLADKSRNGKEQK